MFKFLKYASFAFIASLAFTACSDDDDVTPTIDPVLPSEMSEMYVINQGNQYGGVSGSISQTTFSEGNFTVIPDIFRTTNGQYLGDTPQRAVRYGDKIYVPVFGSNLLWVLDAATLRIEAQVSTQAPEAVCGDGGYVFVASNEGYVTRLDTLDFAAEGQKLNVGPNPAGLTASRGKVYVSISDGYNYANGYADGKKVVAIDTESFQKTAEYAVGINPTQLCSNAVGDVFVICMGNYNDVAPELMKIAANGTVSSVGSASFMTISDNVIYAVSATANYTDNTADMTFTAYNTLNGITSTFPLDADNLPGWPVAIDVNPRNGHIVICADKGPADYDKSGYVWEYKADGSFIDRLEVGIHPFGVIFR